MGLKLLRFGDTRFCQRDGGLRKPSLKNFDRDLRLGQRATNAFDDSGLRQNRVGDHKHTAYREPPGDVTKLLDRIASEKELSCGMKSPGGAHQVASGVRLRKSSSSWSPGFSRWVLSKRRLKAGLQQTALTQGVRSVHFPPIVAGDGEPGSH